MSSQPIILARSHSRKVLATTEDLAFQALGLSWTGATVAELAPVIARLVAGQRADEGFAQQGTLASDAYATGEAIVGEDLYEVLRRNG